MTRDGVKKLYSIIESIEETSDASPEVFATLDVMVALLPQNIKNEVAMSRAAYFEALLLSEGDPIRQKTIDAYKRIEQLDSGDFTSEAIEGIQAELEALPIIVAQAVSVSRKHYHSALRLAVEADLAQLAETLFV